MPTCSRARAAPARPRPHACWRRRCCASTVPRPSPTAPATTVMIANGEHPDVYDQVDAAASRTGVENVREEIIGRVQFAPRAGATRSIYHRRGAHAVDGGVQRAAEDA